MNKYEKCYNECIWAIKDTAYLLDKGNIPAARLLLESTKLFCELEMTKEQPNG
jgi:hypothetical protein